MQSGICFIKISVTSADPNMLMSINEKISMREMEPLLQIRTQDLSLSVSLHSFLFPFPISAFYHHGKNFNSWNEAQEQSFLLFK